MEWQSVDSHLKRELLDDSFKVRRKPERFSACHPSWGSWLEDGGLAPAPMSRQGLSPSSLSQVCLKVPSTLCQSGGQFLYHHSSGFVFVKRQ